MGKGSGAATAVPRLIVTEDAASDLERCRSYLAERNPLAANRAANVIIDKLRLLEKYPAIGRPVRSRLDLRELVIRFGASGYLALYLHVQADDVVYVVAIRHQREVGY